MDRTLRTYVLFCIGLGASVAWWLVMSTDPSSGAQSEQSTTLVIHLCYFTVLLLCFLGSRLLEPLLEKKRTIIVLVGLIASGMSAVAFAPLLLPAIPWISVPSLAIASVAKAVLFLAWMIAFAALSTRAVGFTLMLGSMTIGWVLCLVLSSVPTPISLGAACILPTASALCLIAMMPLFARQSHNDATRETAHRPAPIRTMFPTLLIAGLAIYEFAPGFVTGTLQADSNQGVLISTYALVALLLCIALIAALLLSKTRAWKSIQRFVVPLIAIGLLAIPLLSTGGQAVAFACVIAGTSLFDAFIYTTFAEISHRSKTSPLRVFAFGQLVIQSAILVAFILGIFLAEQASSWISAVCLLLVFLFVLSGRFDLYRTDLAPGSEKQNKSEPATPVTYEAFARECGFSKRETEILGLVMRGRNAPTIAHDLVIAPSTVKTHLAHMYQKADVATRQELVAKADEFLSELDVS